LTELLQDLVAIGRQLGAFERSAVCCGTVTVPQCVALQALLEAPRELGELASFAGSSKSAMTRLVDGLERRGWVSRRRDAEDRRRVVAELTKAGLVEATRLRELTHRTLDGVLDLVPEAKRAQVIESLHLLRSAMDQASELLAGCCGPPAPE
jgi:DNA-binding MarR family transcriptional regulator